MYANPQNEVLVVVKYEQLRTVPHSSYADLLSDETPLIRNLHRGYLSNSNNFCREMPAVVDAIHKFNSP